jgi:hypothetical protein
MDAKEAVKAAKRYVLDIFGDEGLADLGLEEIEKRDPEEAWFITLGFSRPWNRSPLGALGGGAKRDYRVVKVSDVDGEILSVKRLEAAE